MTFDRDVLTPDDAPTPFAPPVSPRSVTLGISLLLTAVLAAVLLVLPAPYAIRAPGPTEDALGLLEQSDGSASDSGAADGASATAVPVVQIEGAPTFPVTGELRLTTVSAFGGPGGDILLGDVLQGWFSTQRSVQPVELVFGEESPQQQQEVLQAQMTSSEQSATVAALTELGFEVPATLTVAAAVPGSGAEGVVEPGDVVRSIGGTPVVTHQDLLTGLDDVTPGDDVVLGVERGGEDEDLTVTTGQGDGRAALGVYLEPEYDYPVDVTIRPGEIGGSSAGTIFALAIIDKLTEADELDGAVVAGTGTMSVDGLVGPIGGIRQKLYGAVRDDAEWFLAPASNCAEVVGNVPDGLRVVRISTLADAREAVEAIGAGEADDLPTCTSGS
ncbi:PDZ domain-containing protein [Isoptericola sp. NEAU-Y5]|uniref:PDZ domain-containing protein n=1 Tax=Isoptericola luteus TaxID=2879484 RepID=A0ABS7ZBP5_9MICO|nr:PDZ domain-containing protein [Isoptericola sp. NEAU-Y5]MCA5892469.1 PDZ domain-containing protein [Isoptericola sp. NEAU-Y5]